MNYLKSRNLELRDIVQDFIYNKKNVKIQSLQRYENLFLNHIKYDLIGSKKIIKLGIKDFIEYFERKNEEKVSISVQKVLFYIIKSSWTLGVNNNLCNYISFDKIKFKKNKHQITVFSKNEQLILEKYLKNKTNIRKVSLLICLYTGIRIGEICGLKWKDVDLDSKIIYINKTIIRIKNPEKDSLKKTIIISSTPKSETSTRKIPIPDFINEILKNFRDKDEYYILSKSTSYYDPRQLEEFYKRTLKKCNIRYSKFHTLRHTFATRCIESGIDVKTLSELLGHASSEITLNIYIHSTTELKRTSVEKLVTFMNL